MSVCARVCVATRCQCAFLQLTEHALVEERARVHMRVCVCVCVCVCTELIIRRIIIFVLICVLILPGFEASYGLWGKYKGVDRGGLVMLHDTAVRWGGALTPGSVAGDLTALAATPFVTALWVSVYTHTHTHTHTLPLHSTLCESGTALCWHPLWRQYGCQKNRPVCVCCVCCRVSSSKLCTRSAAT